MELEGTRWIVTQLEGAPVIEGSQPSILFEGGRAAGTTGCNRWFAAYRAEGVSLSFGPAGSTMMMCPDPGVMEQEQSMLRTLDLVETVTLAEDSLTMSGSEATELLKAESESR